MKERIFIKRLDFENLFSDVTTLIPGALDQSDDRIL